MSRDFVGALLQLNAEKQVSREALVRALEEGIQAAYRRVAGEEDIFVRVEPDSGRIDVYRGRYVVDEIEDPMVEVTVDEARQTKDDAKAGDVIEDGLMGLPFVEEPVLASTGVRHGKGQLLDGPHGGLGFRERVHEPGIRGVAAVRTAVSSVAVAGTGIGAMMGTCDLGHCILLGSGVGLGSECCSTLDAEGPHLGAGSFDLATNLIGSFDFGPRIDRLE